MFKFLSDALLAKQDEPLNLLSPNLQSKSSIQLKKAKQKAFNHKFKGIMGEITRNGQPRMKTETGSDLDEFSLLDEAPKCSKRNNSLFRFPARQKTPRC